MRRSSGQARRPHEAASYVIDRCEGGWAVLVAEQREQVLSLPAVVMPLPCEEGLAVQVRAFPGWARKNAPRGGKRTLSEVERVSEAGFVGRMRGREVTLPRAAVPGRIAPGARFTLLVDTRPPFRKREGVTLLREALSPAPTDLELLDPAGEGIGILEGVGTDQGGIARIGEAAP